VYGAGLLRVLAVAPYCADWATEEEEGDATTAVPGGLAKSGGSMLNTEEAISTSPTRCELGPHSWM
jgi:hypothetical protein